MISTIQRKQGAYEGTHPLPCPLVGLGPPRGSSGLLLGPSRGPRGGPKIGVHFEFTPKRTEQAVGTPRNYPSVTPKKYHGTKGFSNSARFKSYLVC